MNPKMRKAGKKIYFDVCTLCRPYDDQASLRIKLETDAYYLILSHVKSGRYPMIISPAHFSEINDFEDEIEKNNLLSMLEKYKSNVVFDLEKIHVRTEVLIEKKFGIGDAAHLAFAESSADFFISCDDILIKRVLKKDIQIKVMSPIQFCLLEDLK